MRLNVRNIRVKSPDIRPLRPALQGLRKVRTFGGLTVGAYLCER
ncbi:hypothetical protein HRTV-25_gp109 [Halorubrum tailed virus 25]|uniref:Uncharacterized protein n=1 Tax=Halorubrum tailed virus 25 TaxID=2878006 RepID=A0AAE9BXM7_9CAUD|nr:hypothetical protein M1M37_gp109 [Halorubrum tailed virus 25]UBF22690.1 hypothetical protein HRTV-25_gp109 [Halorubrum tailed virus 25]